MSDTIVLQIILIESLPLIAHYLTILYRKQTKIGI